MLIVFSILFSFTAGFTYAQSPEYSRIEFQSLLQKLLANPGKWGFPKELILSEFSIDSSEIILYLSLPAEFLTREITHIHIQEISHDLGMTFFERSGIKKVLIYCQDPLEPTQYRPIEDFVKPILPIKKTVIPLPQQLTVSNKFNDLIVQPKIVSSAQPSGGLTGKTIFISAGHGWVWNSFTNRWETQRPAINGIVEDFSNIEAVAEYLVPYLWNAGASVWVTRATHRDYAMQIIDNTTTNPNYFQSGAWSTLSSGGYGDGSFIYIPASPFDTATVRWQFSISTAGNYPVYAWYEAGADRVSDARYQIGYSGGTAVAIINQKIDGETWRLLGTFYFDATDQGFVQLTDQSSNSSNYITADAIRVGDGWGNAAPEGITSGKLKYDEGSIYWAELQGAPNSVIRYLYGTTDYYNDGYCHQLYPEWEKDSTEDAVILLWHSNASDSAIASGTWSFAHSAYGWGGDFTGVPGGLEIRDIIHNEIVNDIKQGYDPSWYGYTETLNCMWAISTLPGALFEMAFHDNVNRDNKYLHDPKFRQIVARAVYQGIVKYFAARDSTSYSILPDPPTHLKAVNIPHGDILVSWQAPSVDTVNLGGDNATGYKIYLSTNGYGFDTGTYTPSTKYTFSNLSAGQPYYFRISAVNSGGESLPSETITARKSRLLPFTKQNRILVVSGYDQLDSDLLINTKENAEYRNSDGYYYPVTSAGDAVVLAQRMILDKMNPFNSVVRHSQSINASGDFYLDNAVNESVAQGLVNLNKYLILDWILGKEAKAGETLDTIEQNRLKQFLDKKGALFISGSDFIEALDSIGSAADRQFCETYFMSQYNGKNFGNNELIPASSGIFAGMNIFSFDTGDGLYYGAESTDRIIQISWARENLNYANGDFGCTGIQSSQGYNMVLLAVPFEIIQSNSVRNALMYRILKFLANGPTTAIPQELFESYP